MLDTGLFSNLISEVKVILAVAKKDFLIYKRYPLWLLKLLVDPFFFVVSTVYMGMFYLGPAGSAMDAFVEKTGTSNVVAFMLIGVLCWIFIRSTLGQVGMALRREQFRGTLERNIVSPINRVSLIVGKSIAHMLVITYNSSLIFFLTHLCFGLRTRLNPMSIITALVIIFLSVLILYGTGFVFAGLVVVFKETGALIGIIFNGLTALVGVTYPLTVMPTLMQEIALLIPLTRSIRSLRDLFLVGVTPTVLSDLPVLAAFACVVPAVGYFVFKWVEKYARKTGTISYY